MQQQHHVGRPRLPAHGSLEQNHLRIGIPKGEIGALPIYTGFDKGYFKDQGIDVTIDDSYSSYQAALQALSDGKVDLVYDDYVHAILAQSTGAYRLQLVAEGYTAGDGSVQLVSRPTSNKNGDQIKNVFGATGGFLVPTAGTNDANDAYTVPTIMLMTSLPDLANSLRIKAAQLRGAPEVDGARHPRREDQPPRHGHEPGGRDRRAVLQLRDEHTTS